VIGLHAEALSQSFEDSVEMLLGGGLEKLEGALARPEQYASYQRADRALQATVLAHAVVEAHAFRDGNKRTAFVAMHTFLELNGGYTTYAPKQIREQWIIDLATRVSIPVVAASIRQRLIRIP
jgi:death-on-curing family protein